MWLGDAAQGTPTGTAPTDWLTGLESFAQTIVPTVLQTIDQGKLLDYNTALIAAGKTPLTAAQMQALQAGSAPTLNLGLSGQTQSLLTDALIGGALLIGGYLLISSISKRR